MSLKSKIETSIKQKGHLTLDEVFEIAQDGGYKQRTAERTTQLIAKTGLMKPEYNLKGHLIGYKLINTYPEALQCDLTHDTPLTKDFIPLQLFKPRETILKPKSPYDY
jgi:hypothetical protein